MPSFGGWHSSYAPLDPPENIKYSKRDKTAPHSPSVLATAAQHASDRRVGFNATPNHKTQQTALPLWLSFERLLNEAELQQIPILSSQMAEKLRKNSEPQIYQRVNSLLAEPNISLEIKAILLDLLAEIATPDSLEQLIDLAKQNKQSSLHILVLQALSRIGDNRWDGEFHEELSPLLVAAWTNPETTDPAFLGAVGKAIATVGAPKGIDELLQTVSGGTKGTEPEDVNRVKQAVAFTVIPQVRNADSIDVLSTWLNQEPLGTPAFEVSGNALAKIGSAQAIQEIIVWAKNAPKEGVRNLADWLSKIDYESALAAISTAQPQAFKSTEIAAVINSAATNNETMALSTASTIRQNNPGTPLLPLSDK